MDTSQLLAQWARQLAPFESAQQAMRARFDAQLVPVMAAQQAASAHFAAQIGQVTSRMVDAFSQFGPPEHLARQLAPLLASLEAQEAHYAAQRAQFEAPLKVFAAKMASILDAQDTAHAQLVRRLAQAMVSGLRAPHVVAAENILRNAPEEAAPSPAKLPVIWASELRARVSPRTAAIWALLGVLVYYTYLQLTHPDVAPFTEKYVDIACAILVTIMFLPTGRDGQG